jgi:hypothetical protein
MRRLALLLVFTFGCGIKAPPRPPLPDNEPPPAEATPDAGCCRP